MFSIAHSFKRFSASANLALVSAAFAADGVAPVPPLDGNHDGGDDGSSAGATPPSATPWWMEPMPPPPPPPPVLPLASDASGLTRGGTIAVALGCVVLLVMLVVWGRHHCCGRHSQEATRVSTSRIRGGFGNLSSTKRRFRGAANAEEITMQHHAM